MNNKSSLLGFLLMLFLSVPFAGGAQSKFSAVTGTLAINGTSTLHDWEMTAQKPFCEALFVQNPAGALTDLSALSFSIPAESLKSGKGAMDKNAYKALKTSAAKNITFTATDATISAAGANAYQVKCTGKLTIAGTTRETDLVAVCKVNPDKTLQVTGTKKIKMTDYKVEPPSFMFGSVTTGNDLAINFNVTLRK